MNFRITDVIHYVSLFPGDSKTEAGIPDIGEQEEDE